MVTLTVYSISAAVFNLDDMFPLNLQVEVQNGVLMHHLKIRTGRAAISSLLLCSSLGVCFYLWTKESRFKNKLKGKEFVYVINSG